MTVHKAERLLNLIVCLLETERPVTVQQIQDTIPGYGGQGWEAFKRMFERDKDALREVGIPLERSPVTVQGEREEGYRIPKERYYLPDLELAEEELAALWLAAGLVRLQDPETARAAMLKLAGELPSQAGPDRLSWLSADLGLSVAGLPRAFEAVADRRSLAFSYRGGSGEQQRTLDPYGLVHRKGAWYLVGRDHGRDQVRSFRLDRIVGDMRFHTGGGAPQASGPEFEPPAGFRPQQALEMPPFAARPGQAGTQHAGTEQAVVNFDASTAWWVERSHPWLRLEWGPLGSATAHIPVADGEGLISWVLSLGEGVELMQPPELRQAILARLDEACG